MQLRDTHSAFTLIEVQVSILVLVIGLAAGLSLVLTGNEWGRELRRDVIALSSARMVADNPRLLDPLVPLATADPLEGYYNDFYFRRTVAPMQVPNWDETIDAYRQVTLPAESGVRYSGTGFDVQVEAYEGVIDADIDTGTHVVTLSMKVLMP